MGRANLKYVLICALFMSACQKAKLRKIDPGQARPPQQQQGTTPTTPTNTDGQDEANDTGNENDPGGVIYQPGTTTVVPGNEPTSSEEGENTQQEVTYTATPVVIAPAPEHETIRVQDNLNTPILDKCLGETCKRESPVIPPIPPPRPKPIVKAPIPQKKPVRTPEVFQCVHEQRLEPITEKLDILFVIDTSQSLDAEREKIASELDKFIDGLARYGNKVDYRIAVMLAHAPGSQIVISDTAKMTPTPDREAFKYFDVSGSLFQSETAQESVLALSKNGKDAGNGMDLSEIKQKLREKLHDVINAREKSDVPGEKASTAQGEVGLLSLYNGLMSPKKMQAMTTAQPYGFMRSDAALAVIFVADENDVCFDYNSESAKSRGITPRWKSAQPGVQDPKEVQAFKEVCFLDNGKTLLTPNHVHKALIKTKGQMPVILSGILYTDNNNIPKTGKAESKGASFEENEAGHGYLDLIRLANGEAQDLGGGIVGDKLAAIGDLSAFKMNFEHAFLLLKSDGSPVTDYSGIDTATLTVEVYDAKGANLLRTFKGHNEVTLVVDLGDRKRPNKITAVVKAEKLKDIVQPGQKVIVKWQYL